MLFFKVPGLITDFEDNTELELNGITEIEQKRLIMIAKVKDRGHNIDIRSIKCDSRKLIILEDVLFIG